MATTFNFTTGVVADNDPNSGVPTNKASQTIGADTLTVTVDAASNAALVVMNDVDFFGIDVPNLNGAAVETTFDAFSNSITLTLDSGKLFDLTSINLYEEAAGTVVLILTTSKGSVQVPVDSINFNAVVVALSDAKLQGVSSVTITEQGAGAGMLLLALDDVVLNNINVVPAFVSPNTPLSVAQNSASAAGALATLLHVSDTDSSQTETWTQFAGPSHGTLNLTGATAASGGVDIAPGGTLSYTPTAGYSGTDSFTVKVSDGATTATRVITVNVGPATPGTPDLAAASDSGVLAVGHATDNITNAASLTFSGTSAAGDSASTVRVFLDKNNNGVYEAGTDATATATVSNGAWTVNGVSTAGLNDGDYNVYAQVKSADGTLTSAASSALVVHIDKTAPTQTLSGLSLSADTGVAGDFITKTAAQTVHATLSAGLAAGEALYGSLDGGSTWSDISAKVSGTTLDWTGVTLANGTNNLQLKVADLAGNDGTVASHAYTLDTVGQTAAIVVANNALGADVTSLVTISFSEAVTGFDNSDLSLANGTLSAVSSADGGVTWTATLTPNANVNDATNLITINNAGVTDLAGNAGVGTTDSNNYAVNSVRPGVQITVLDSTPADGGLKIGDTATVTFQFSEAVSGFSLADISVGHGTLNTLTTSDNITYTATFTPDAATTSANNVVTVDLSGVVGSLNAGAGSATSLNYVVDTVRPTATVNVVGGTLLAGATAVVQFTFSEALANASFTTADVTVQNGTLSNLTTTDNIHWSATLTPAAGIIDATNLLTLDATGITDLAGNAGSGTVDSNNYSLSTVRPTATIVVADNALTAGETSAVTITFSEAVSGFDNTHLSVGHGTLSVLASTDGGVSWTGTLTPDANTNSNGNVITLTGAGVLNAAGNAVLGSVLSNSYAVDTAPPPPPDTTPPTMVDGVPVISQTSIDPVTGVIVQTVTVPIVPVGRADDPGSPNSTLADIPLGVAASGGNPGTTLTFSLQAGTGLKFDGPQALLNNDKALLDLINRIDANTASGSSAQQELSGEGASFLKSLFSEVKFQTATVVPIVDSSVAGAKTISISGSSLQPADGAHNPTAIGLVIDASLLPDNVTLLLNNVDFAAVVGAATLRGGDGQNYVVGDDSAQNIMLGAGDDTLFGGGGNDVVGSAGGNDYLDGGSGNDIVVGGIGNDKLFGGSGNDVLQGGRSDSGQWQFVLGADGKLSATHQTAVFAPQASETLQVSELNTASPALAFLGASPALLKDLAALYHAAFDRAPDLDAVNTFVTSGVSAQQVANAFLLSPEWLAKHASSLSDSAFVDLLYHQVLGRDGDASGSAWWLAELGNGHSRGEVLLQFARSDEYQAMLAAQGPLQVASTTLGGEKGWIAGSGNDYFDGGAGSDIIVGGDGDDTIAYAGKLAQYKLLLTSDGKVQVADTASADTDTISGIEHGAFSDGTVDLTFTQASAATLETVGLLYQAVLDRAGELAGMAHWVASGASVQQLAASFVGSSEFQQHYGAMSNSDFVHALYANSALADNAAGGSQQWTTYLATHTRAELVAAWVSNDTVVSAQFGSHGLWL